MDIAIIGAAGVIGRQVAIALVEQTVVPVAARLQLVGRAGGNSEHILPGLAHDLLDAHGETCPEIDICYRPEDVVADVWVIAGGQTMPIDRQTLPRREQLGRANLGLFEKYADALQRYGHGEEIVMVVTNPVELGVAVFSARHDPRRVLGMGAYLDTLRFRQEIARELTIRRQQVSALALGDHGGNLVPCWSTVRFSGMPGVDGSALIKRLRRPCDQTPQAVLTLVIDVLRCEGVAAAYRLAAQYPADVRTFLLPLVTHMSGARTPVATAEMITRLIGNIINGEHVFSAVQARIDGEVYGLHGVTGVPAILSNQGIERFEDVPLWDEELQRIGRAIEDYRRLEKEITS